MNHCHFKQIKTEFISVHEMNKHLAFVKKYRSIRYSSYNVDIISICNAFIEDKMKEFRLTYSKGNHPVTYICFKDNDRKINMNGLEAWRIVNLYYKIPIKEANFSVAGLLWKNDKYDGTRNFAFGYDMNSCYSWAMLQPMPDTAVDPVSKNVEAGEIGFGLAGERIKSGFATFVFPLMESPFKRFVARWYPKKKKAKTFFDRQKAKNVLNYSVGYFQLKNPFLRAQIIGLANERILSLIDEDTIYCNTDSIVSLKERKDLKISKEIGDWKLEHKGQFAFVGFNYQWNMSPPAYRGIPKSWFKDNWDILADPIPNFGNMYKFDYLEVKLVEEKIESEEEKD